MLVVLQENRVVPGTHGIDTGTDIETGENVVFRLYNTREI